MKLGQMIFGGKKQGLLFWIIIIILVGVGIFTLAKLRNTVTVENPPVPESEQIRVISSSDKPVIEEPEPVPEANPKIEVLDNSLGYLNVRDASSTSGKRIDRVQPGQQYEYTEIKNNWYHILLSDGKDGWVSGQYVKEVEAQEEGESSGQ